MTHFADPILRLGQLHDPVTEDTGHAIRSPYVEQFWLPTLGPSAWSILRRLHLIHSAEAPNHNTILHVDFSELAADLGMGTATATRRARSHLGRLADHGCGTIDGSGPEAVFRVRYALPDINPNQARRLTTGNRNRLANHVLKGQTT